jgi:predicted Rossmann-fold nucleotide-binding protein
MCVVVAGGLGTMDELFELLTLVQLCKLPSMASLPSPIILINYDGFFDGLVKFLRVRESQ